MRFIHTSDWHLGKSLKGESLLDDQAHILDEILRAVDDQHVDAIVIAGDIYDRSVPPADAVDLFNDVILRLVERKLPILCIVGNHDSPQRLNFCSKLLERSDFFLRSLIRADDDPVVLDDQHGRVYFSLLPYFDPAHVRDAFGVDRYLSYDEAGFIYVGAARNKIPRGVRSIAVSHAFITNAERSASETQSVGGADNISASNFDGYDYVALGHLHKPQRMSHSIRYSGSPLKYSFDEWKHRKGLLSVELDGAGRTTIEFLPLTPRHDLRVVEDTMSNILRLEPTTDYVAVRLTDRVPVLNARVKLEGKFPNVLSLEKIGLTLNSSVESERSEGTSVLEQFRDFFEYQTGEAMSREEEAALTECLVALGEDH